MNVGKNVIMGSPEERELVLRIDYICHLFKICLLWAEIY